MRCKNCGADNDDNRYICEVCGSPLYDEDDFDNAANDDNDKTQTFKAVNGENYQPQNNNNNNNNDYNDNQYGKPQNNNGSNKNSEKKSLIIIAILAVMKSGGAYIPIDPGFPEDRINYMLSSSSASVLLTNKKLESKIDFEHKVTIDLDNNDIYSLPNENIENINTLDDLLYVIFTSGSTAGFVSEADLLAVTTVSSFFSSTSFFFFNEVNLLINLIINK